MVLERLRQDCGRGQTDCGERAYLKAEVAIGYGTIVNTPRQRKSLPRSIAFCHNDLRRFSPRTCCDGATFELDARHRCVLPRSAATAE
jgi:hypothetical protein